MIVASLAAAGWLFLAPSGLAAVRFLGVSLAWWTAFGAYAVGAAALVFGLRAQM